MIVFTCSLSELYFSSLSCFNLATNCLRSSIVIGVKLDRDAVVFKLEAAEDPRKEENLSVLLEKVGLVKLDSIF
jgi:hypothetical protein